MSSLGDFFLNLGIQTDKNSVETANKSIDSVSNSMNRLMGTIRNAAAVAAVMKGIQGAAADNTLAYSMKIGTEALNTWRTAVKLSGADANAFISKISELDTKFRKLSIDGTFDQNLADKLGLLKINYGDLTDMNADDRTRVIYEAAQQKYNDAPTQEEKDKVSIIVGDILGQSGRQMFEYMTRNGKTVDYYLSRSQGTLFETDDEGKASESFREEFNLLKSSIKSLGKLFGSEIGQGLTPVLEELNTWLQENRTTIKTLADDLGTIAAWVGKKAQPLIEGAGNVATDVTGAIASAIEGDWEEANNKIEDAGLNVGTTAAAVITGQSLDEAKTNFYNRTELISILSKMWGEKYGDHPVLNQLKKLKYNELPDDVKESIDKNGGKKEWKTYVNDGIIRPNGQVTQVAPDDWVFAARSIGDLASAFIPQQAPAANGPVEIAITQNFTVNGGNEIPQVIKQQAYNGTYNGLNEVLAKAGVRMQLMPGLR